MTKYTFFLCQVLTGSGLNHIKPPTLCFLPGKTSQETALTFKRRTAQQGLGFLSFACTHALMKGLQRAFAAGNSRGHTKFWDVLLSLVSRRSSLQLPASTASLFVDVWAFLW